MLPIKLSCIMSVPRAAGGTFPGTQLPVRMTAIAKRDGMLTCCT